MTRSNCNFYIYSITLLSKHYGNEFSAQLTVEFDNGKGKKYKFQLLQYYIPNHNSFTITQNFQNHPV